MELLDDEWLGRVAACSTLDLADVGLCTFRVDVTGTPNGTRTWALEVRDGAIATCTSGAPERATVVLTITWVDAQRIAAGELGVNAAFMQGRLKTDDGPTAPLLALLSAVSAPEAQRCLAALRGSCAGLTPGWGCWH